MLNEAPEKIYMTPSYGEPDNVLLASFSKSHLDFHRDIKYTRTDVLLYKLECWMNENFHFHAGEFAEGILAQFDRTEDAIEDFRKYIKGE